MTNEEARKLTVAREYIESLEIALRAYLSAGIGNSTSFSKQADAYAKALDAFDAKPEGV